MILKDKDLIHQITLLEDKLKATSNLYFDLQKRMDDLERRHNKSCETFILLLNHLDLTLSHYPAIDKIEKK